MEPRGKSNHPVALGNRQQRYGGPPPDWTDPPPKKGSEVFVGKIPRKLTEKDLLPLFEKVGRVYEMRLMMDLNGDNRGFAFVTFSNPQEAAKAIQQLNRYEIQPKKCIGVIRSLDNCRLFLGGIPKDKSEDDVRVEMSRYTENVTDVIVYSSITDNSKNRGYAFVEYQSHRAASIARQKCIKDQLQLWGRSVVVDWAEPEPIVEEEVLSKVRILHIRNLIASTTEDDLQQLFDAASDNGVEKVKKMNGFAFVHFVTRQQAEQALQALQNQSLKGAPMQISWAKPAQFRRFCSNPSQPKASLHEKSMTQSNIQPSIPVTYFYPRPNLPAACDTSHHANYVCHKETPTFHSPQNYCYPISSSSPPHLPIGVLHSQYPSRPQIPIVHSSLFADHHRANVASSASAGCVTNAEALVSWCQSYNIVTPEIETTQYMDLEQYTAKVSLSSNMLPFSVLLSTNPFPSKEEAREAVCGYALDYLQHVFRVYSSQPFTT